MQIKSNAFAHMQMIPQKYACDGENLAPELEILEVPENAKTLALIVHDDDAPVEGGWTHWIIFNIEPKAQKIVASKLPKGAIESKTSFGVAGYGGPCPPSGTHHYEFRLYALDSDLPLDQNAKKADVERAMENRIIEKTVLVGLYSKKD